MYEELGSSSGSQSSHGQRASSQSYFQSYQASVRNVTIMIIIVIITGTIIILLHHHHHHQRWQAGGGGYPYSSMQSAQYMGSYTAASYTSPSPYDRLALLLSSCLSTSTPLPWTLTFNVHYQEKWWWWEERRNLLVSIQSFNTDCVNWFLLSFQTVCSAFLELNAFFQNVTWHMLGWIK